MISFTEFLTEQNSEDIVFKKQEEFLSRRLDNGTFLVLSSDDSGYKLSIYKNEYQKDKDIVTGVVNLEDINKTLRNFKYPTMGKSEIFAAKKTLSDMLKSSGGDKKPDYNNRRHQSGY